MIAETGSEVRRVYDLNFGQCQLALQAPTRSNIRSPKVPPRTRTRT
jgi:ATP phosphoribosyltransferase